MDAIEPGSEPAPTGTSYVDLLGWAAELQHAALGKDVESLHVQVSDLREALLAQMESEADSFDDVSPAVADVIRSGQRRLLTQIDTLVDRSSHDAHHCRCVEGTALLTAALRRQGRMESGLRKR